MYFNHLNYPAAWRAEYSKYPEGLSILESLMQWIKQVDDMVDSHNANQTTINGFGDRLDDFIAQYDTHLQATLTETLTAWQTSGFLDVVISAALQTEMDNLATKANSIQSQVDTLVINADGTANAENIQARVDRSGVIFPVLKNHLDYIEYTLSNDHLKLTSPTWVSGTLSAGAEVANANRVRSGFIAVPNTHKVRISVVDGYKVSMSQFDESNIYIPGSASAYLTGEFELEIRSNTKTVRFVVGNVADSAADVSYKNYFGASQKLISPEVATLQNDYEDSLVTPTGLDYPSAKARIEHAESALFAEKTDLIGGWVLGGQETNTGEDIPSSTRIRSNSYPIYQDGDLFIGNTSGGIVWVFTYDFSGAFVPPYVPYSDSVVKIPVVKGNTYKLNLFKSDGIALSDGDNVSIAYKPFTYTDKVFNGFDKGYILLNFDLTTYMSDTAISPYRTREELLKEYGYKGTLAIGYDILSGGSAQAFLDKTLNEYGWDFALYGIAGTHADYDTYVKNYISDSSHVDDITTRLQAYVDKFAEFGVYNPVAYFCRNNANGNALTQACKNVGLKLARAISYDGSAVPNITESTKIPNTLSIGTLQNYHVSWNLQTVKDLIDEVVDKKGVLSIMTHRLWENIANSDSPDGDNTIANYRAMLDYIKIYADQNRLAVITWKELYEMMAEQKVILSDVDFSRLQKQITALATRVSALEP